uniref:Uridine-cytidine kinase 2 n=2 Tax=Schistocephalus solidus TaxID=70667 RepID=A0A0X3PRR1_SCHSO
MKIFVEADADTRLSRKVLLDVCERKRNLNTVLENYFNFVKPAFEEFCLPTKKYADVILPRAPDNVVGVELIIEHLLQMMANTSNTANTSVQRLRFRNQSESATGRIRPH